MALYTFILKRLLFLIFVLIGISVITFLMIHSIPGDPVVVMIGSTARDVPPEMIDKMRHELGLDEPLYVQYYLWMKGIILQGYMGRSLRTDRLVTTAISQMLPVTIWLAVWSTIFSAIFGIPFGILAAMRRGSLMEKSMMNASFIGVSIPNFVLGLILILIFGGYWQILPPSGYTPISESFTEWFKSLLLPTVAIGVGMAALIFNLVRANALEIIDSDFIMFARAKGLPYTIIKNKHILKNALLPTVTILGINFGHLLGGIVIIESIFALPGIGRLILVSIFRRDYIIVQGAVLVVAALYALITLITDITYSYIDPRIKY